MNFPTNCPHCRAQIVAETKDIKYCPYCKVGSFFAFYANEYVYNIVSSNLKYMLDIYKNDYSSRLYKINIKFSNEWQENITTFDEISKFDFIPNIDLSDKLSIDDAIKLLLTFN